MGNITKTAEQKEAEKLARRQAAAETAGVEALEVIAAPAVSSDDDGVTGLVPDTVNIPELQKPQAITDRDVRMAEEVGLPPLPKKYTQKYLDLREIYIRFIRQSPHKWNIKTDDTQAALRALNAIDITK